MYSIHVYHLMVNILHLKKNFCGSKKLELHMQKAKKKEKKEKEKLGIKWVKFHIV